MDRALEQEINRQFVAKFHEVYPGGLVDDFADVVRRGYHANDLERIRELALLALKVRCAHIITLYEMYDDEQLATGQAPWSSRRELADKFLNDLSGREHFSRTIGLLTQAEIDAATGDIKAARPDIWTKRWWKSQPR